MKKEVGMLLQKRADTRAVGIYKLYEENTHSVFVPLCSSNTCKDVFNPNVTAFQSNCAEGLLHFSAFHLTIAINKLFYLLSLAIARPRDY